MADYEKFSLYTQESAELYVNKYNRYYMPSSYTQNSYMDKVLFDFFKFCLKDNFQKKHKNLETKTIRSNDCFVQENVLDQQ